MKTKWISLFLFYAIYWCASAIDNDDIGNANEYVDAALENLRQEPEISKHLDPLTVPDYIQKDFNVKNFKIKGLLSLYRHGDCSLSYENKKLNVQAEIAVKDVSITLDYSAKALFFWIHGSSIMSVDHLAVRLDFTSINGYAHLNSFKVINLGNYKVKKITGASFVLNWLLKLIANGAAQGARQNIINALENEAGRALGELLRKHKLPIY